MTTYCYIRTSKAREDGQAGCDPEVQRRQLRDVGGIDRNIFADMGVSGAAGVKTRNQWHALDQPIGQDDVLVVAVMDHIGRRFLDTMWAIYDLQLWEIAYIDTFQRLEAETLKVYSPERSHPAFQDISSLALSVAPAPYSNQRGTGRNAIASLLLWRLTP